MGIAQALQSGVETAVSTYATTVSAGVASALIPIAISGVTIYIILLGWAIARGDVQNSLSQVTWKIFKISLICTIATAGGVYQNIVVNFITGIEGIFTTAIGGQPTIGALIDANIVPMETITGQLYVQANAPPLFPDFRLLIAAVLCTFGQVLITLAALIPLLVAKVTVALLLAIGPAFILLALWPQTQRYTEAWLAASIAATFTVVVIAAVVGFLPVYINYYAGQVLANIATTNVLQDVIYLLIVILVLAWIAWKAADFGAQIVGGSSMGNPAQSVAQTIMNRLAFGGRRPNPPGNTASTNTISPSAKASTPLAQQNVITNLNRN